MKLIAFRRDAGPRLGALLGDRVVDLTALGGPADLDSVLAEGGDAFARLSALVRDDRDSFPAAEITAWLPPVARPSKAIAVGLNYVDHAAEGNFEPPKYPILFSRYPTSWVGHAAPLIRPKVSTAFDYEGELVVVIGKGGRYISKADALSHVAGYSIFNEGSVRDYQMRAQQWTIGKNFDRSGSFGPLFITADELPPGARGLQLQTNLNGQVMQDANTRDMIFDVATLIVTVSEAFALTPGDMIISGTPAGVGVARTPPVFLKPGDVCTVSIEGVGVLSNPVQAED